MEPGVTPSVPFGLLPVPVSETETEGFEALDMSERVALTAPTIVGEKVTERFAVALAASV